MQLEPGRISNLSHYQNEVAEAIQPFPEMAEMVGEVAMPFDRATGLEAILDNLLQAALQEAVGTPLAVLNGWRYGAPRWRRIWRIGLHPILSSRWAAM